MLVDVREQALSQQAARSSSLQQLAISVGEVEAGLRYASGCIEQFMQQIIKQIDSLLDIARNCQLHFSKALQHQSCQDQALITQQLMLKLQKAYSREPKDKRVSPPSHTQIVAKQSQQREHLQKEVLKRNAFSGALERRGRKSSDLQNMLEEIQELSRKKGREKLQEIAKSRKGKNN